MPKGKGTYGTQRGRPPLQMKENSGFKMKYRGNPSAFPFKQSPMQSTGSPAQASGDSPMKVLPAIAAGAMWAYRGIKALKWAKRARGLYNIKKGQKLLGPGKNVVSTKVKGPVARNVHKIKSKVGPYMPSGKTTLIATTAYMAGSSKSKDKSAKDASVDLMKNGGPKNGGPKNGGGGGGGGGGKISYKQAYQKRGKLYKDMSEAAYIKEAKRQKAVHKKTGKWDVKKSYPKS